MSSLWGYGGEEVDPLLTQVLPDLPVSFGPPPTAEIQFLNLTENKLFEKVQSRKGGVAKQILENGRVEMRATYGPDDLLRVRGWVRREPQAAQLCNDTNEMVLLRDSTTGVELNLVQSTDIQILSYEPRMMSQSFSVDLSKIYEGHNQPVFKLAKTDTVVRNRFQLVIQVEFALGHNSEYFVSPTFMCRTKPTERKTKRKAERDLAELPSPKMQHAEPPPSVDSGTSDMSSLFGVETPSPLWPGSQNDNFLVANLEARTATIDDLVVRNSFETPNADIAYHLHIEDEEMAAELEEGDIVGFFTEKKSGETYIKRLLSGDMEEAVHAGVVSRSYYLAANKQQGKSSTDTVCVIGIVNVKVIGSVENGERIYASVKYPGKAIPQSHLPIGCFLRRQHILLGMSMEKKSAKSLEDAMLVKCFVCIVLDVNRKEVLDEIEKLYEITERSTHEKIRAAQKKAWRRLQCCFVFTLTFLILLSVLLYQVLAPGSLFRYWLCRQGCISGYELHFDYIPKSDVTQLRNAHGLLFTFNKALDKISETIPKNEKIGGQAFYYLNIDRCAFSGASGPVGNYIGGHKNIGGGKIMSVDKNCTKVYYFGVKDTAPLSWHVYNSANNLRCDPLPKY